jgi:alpha-beta hydrolase superfamily lysophospholipase
VRPHVLKFVKRAVVVTGIAAATLLAGRAWQSQQGAPLEPWHTHIPPEMQAPEIAASDWPSYLAKESALFQDVRVHVVQNVTPEQRVPSNRYFAESPVNPGRFATDWNRSFVLEPVGRPAGAVVLLHGLTDSPYSLRHVARRYQEDGFVAVGIRLPGHGTVPAGLVDVRWEAWMEATRLAVREAMRRAGPGVPLHIAGYSNGGALAVKYALDALADSRLARPDRIVLFAPMIGVTSLARFAGFFGWPAVLPRYAKAAWIGIVPEFNPFKYNSFPVNGARQSSLLSRALQSQISDAARAGKLGELAPILTFQSVVDFTVSTRAIIDALYGQLPANGSELVLFDLNRAATFGPLLPITADQLLSRQLPAPPRSYTVTIVANARADSPDVVARTTCAGSVEETAVAVGLAYPPEVFSLSHLAIPFPLDDSLYGMRPDGREDFGVHLGALAARGERGLLVVSMDSLLRMTSNPFFPYIVDRIDQLTGRAQAPAGKP